MNPPKCNKGHEMTLVSIMELHGLTRETWVCARCGNWQFKDKYPPIPIKTDKEIIIYGISSK